MARRNPVLSKHMKKAVERLETLSGTVNLAIEVVDARAPISTRCGMMTKVLRGSHQVKVLTKTDLADPAATKEWLDYFKDEGVIALVFPYGKKGGRKTFIKSIRDECGNSSRIEDQVKAVVVGLPNVGKSTVLNMLTGKKRAQVGAMPGVTRGVQLVNIDKGFLILDTPGVVSTSVAGGDNAKTLALVGCLQDKFFEPVDAVDHLLELSLPEYAGKFLEFYDLPEAPSGGEEFYKIFAKRRGLLKKGGVLDLERVSPIVLRDFATGRLSGMTLERVPS